MSIELISVIVPVYNIAAYLPKSIESLLSQTYQNIEIITVDDGSTDNSLEVLHHMEKNDERIRVIHQDNGGVTKARLTGVAAAQGEWIGFMDGDDYIESDMYEHLLKNAHQYNADVSHCGYQMVFPSRVDYYYNKGHLIRQDQETGLKDLLEGSFVEPGLVNKLFRKNLFHSLLHKDVMDFTIKNKEDLLMNFYLFREARTSVYEDFCPYHYVVRVGSAAKAKINAHKLMDPLKVLLKLEDETDYSKKLNLCVKRRIVMNLINLSTFYTREHETLVKPFRKQSREELRRRLPEIFRGDYSIKLKALSAWAAFMPYGYYLVHNMYSIATGHNRKYDVK